MKKEILLLPLSLFLASTVCAQVNIGSKDTPEQAAILQVKEHKSATEGGETVTKGGLLLPRVKLNGLSDITVIASSADQSKKLALTGLLVYNVDTTKIDKGLYVWDGKEWNQLEILSEKEGSFTKKSLVQGSLSASNLPVAEKGIFSFRFSSDKKPQCKLNISPPADLSVYYHIGRFWDFNGPGVVNAAPPNVGYTYDVSKLTFTTANYSQWQDLHSVSMTQDVRYEIWLSDSINNRAYKVQFITYTILKTQAYVVLVTEY
jgi:hypothetical protein